MSEAARTVELRFTEAPRDARWGAPSATGSGLLGWVLSAQPVDAGVPGDVAAILSRALCAFGRVTFLSGARAAEASPTWQPTPFGAARVVEGPGVGRGLPRCLFGKHPLPLVCTDDPAVAAELFDDDAFPWVQGGQLAILSPLGAPPPELGYAAVAGAFDPALTRERIGDVATGVMQPGPDGDFARLAAWGDGGLPGLTAQISSASRLAGVRFAVVDESEFNGTTWWPEEP